MPNNITSIESHGNAFSDPNMACTASWEKAEQLARSLNLMTQLPEGDAYVSVLGDGTEQSNIAALSTWVKRNYQAVADLSPADQVTALVAHLRAHLNDLLSEAG